jgi:hypothetical protein
MNKRFLSFLIVFSLALASCLPFAMPAQAINLKNAFNNSGIIDASGGRAGFNTNQRNVEPIIGNIISVILSFLGVIFLLLMLYGGYMWMSAMGNEEKVRKAQALIVAAVLGLIVVVGAFAVTVFVMSRLTTAVINSESSLIK